MTTDLATTVAVQQIRRACNALVTDPLEARADRWVQAAQIAETRVAQLEQDLIASHDETADLARQVEDARQEVGRLRHAQESTDVELRGPLLDVLLDGAPSARPTQDLLHDLLEAYQTYRMHSIELNSVGWAAIRALRLGDALVAHGWDTSELVDSLIQSREAALTAADEFREQLAEQKKSRSITVNVKATVNGAPASETVHRAVADALHQAARRGHV